MDKKNIQHWNKAAREYCGSIGNIETDLRVIYQPAIDELLARVDGKRILDAGCGEGHYSRRLSSQGAFVTGIDGSKKMIALAKKKKTKTQVDHRVMDLTQKLDFPEREFDIVLANMVFMDIPRVDVAGSEFARILKKDGSLILSITHPCFFCYIFV